MLGVDASLTSTGFAYWGSNGLMTGRITTDELRGPYRLSYVKRMLSKVIDGCRPDMMVIEDYAMGFGGSRGGKVFHIGELGGVLKEMVWDRGIDILPVGPTVMKSVIAGNGKAEKKHVSAALLKHFGLRVAQNDEADAVGLLLVGEMFNGSRMAPVHPLPPKGKPKDRMASVRDLQVIKGRLQSISNPSS